MDLSITSGKCEAPEVKPLEDKAQLEPEGLLRLSDLEDLEDVEGDQEAGPLLHSASRRANLPIVVPCVLENVRQLIGTKCQGPRRKFHEIVSCFLHLF
jgi:hypothetical protein